MKLTDERRDEIFKACRYNERIDRDYGYELLESEQAGWLEVSRLQQEVTTWNTAAETQKENNLSLAMEVKRLKEENDRLRGLYEREREIAEQKQQLAELQDKQLTEASGAVMHLGRKLQDALNTINEAQYYLSRESYLPAEDVLQQAIDRLQGSEQSEK